jgi:glycolate oxidase FAD binding subunit
VSPDVADALEAEGCEVLREGRLPVACPRDEDQLARLLLRAEELRLRVAPCGLGSKLTWCRPEVLEGALDCALSLRRMDRVTDYVAGDGTVTAQAGVRMADLAQTVAEGGHHLTPDVPNPLRATLGGVLGAGLSGPDRLRYGPLRHHVLGARVMLADRTSARCGGKLVKNVTGFDLQRLYTGSRGTLVVLLEASLRLFPEPDEERAIEIGYADAGAALVAAERLRLENLDPLALTVEGGPNGWRLQLFLGGRADQLEWARSRALELLPAGLVERGASEARNRRAEVRDLSCRGGAWPTFAVSTSPPRAAAAVATVQAELADPAARFVVQPGVCTLDVFAPALAARDVGAVTESLRALRARLDDVPARLQPRALPGTVHAALAPSLAAAPAGRWMRALAQRFDPLERFASPSFPGRP